jgi:hypothetical protein
MRCTQTAFTMSCSSVELHHTMGPTGPTDHTIEMSAPLGGSENIVAAGAWHSLAASVNRLEVKLEANTKCTMHIIQLLKNGVEKLESMKATIAEKQATAANSRCTCLQCNICMHNFPNQDEEDTTNYIVLLGCGACVHSSMQHSSRQLTNASILCAQDIFFVHTASERKTSAQRAEGL